MDGKVPLDEGVDGPTPNAKRNGKFSFFGEYLLKMEANFCF